MAATTSEGMVYVWDRESGRLLAAMTRHADAANEVAFDPDDLDHMFSAGDDGFMVSFDCELCSLGVDELKAAAEDRLAQEVDVTDERATERELGSRRGTLPTPRPLR